ncbi:MAG: primosomal protein N' [Candidatus Izemoplasmatales bacterium]
MIAKVLVDVSAKQVDRLFDYVIPSWIEPLLERGMRVTVQFGHRTVMGFVLEITENSEESPDKLKPILSILDFEPMITDELIELAYGMQGSTASTLIKIIETMIPSALKAVYKISFQVLDESKLPQAFKEQLLGKPTFEYTKVWEPYSKEIKRLIKENVIKQNYDIVSRSNIITKKYVKLLNPVGEFKNDKQRKIISYLSNTDEDISVKSLIEKLDVSLSILRTLEKYENIEIYDKEEYREIKYVMPPKKKEIILNEEQNVAYQKIIDSLHQSQTFLLHGVTGSGKTEIYIKVIEKVLEEGNEALFLVPEIALTPMMVSRFEAHFKGQIAVLHSGLSIGEKYDEWRKIIRSEVSIVIGARSACFAPLKKLAVMIVDEAHESTYKQDEMPSYYAIDVLEQRSKQLHVPLVLGSATPNIESYARYKRGYYELLELKKRALNSFEPDIEIIDMRQEFKKGTKGLFSERLLDEIKIRLNKKEQVILLLNRRGYSSFLMCRTCGHVITCPNCDISLVHHDTDHTLKCHYCGHKEAIPEKCPKCESTDLVYYGSGTQKASIELQTHFPQAHIVRMDNDTTRTKNAHELLLHEFEEKGDILLGTQMIAKGLDFPKVTLVGILQADGNLYSPDFRAPEKTFQLIMQVSGRSGRHDLKGKVIVEAFNPEHYALHYAVMSDYNSFYEYEMRLRKISRYSPFYFINKITLQGENVRDVFVRGYEIVKNLRAELSSEAIILGPTLPIVSRIKGKYRAEILIKYRQEKMIVSALKQIKETYETDQIYIAIDMFPVV